MGGAEVCGRTSSPIGENAKGFGSDFGAETSSVSARRPSRLRRLGTTCSDFREDSLDAETAEGSDPLRGPKFHFGRGKFVRDAVSASTTTRSRIEQDRREPVFDICIYYYLRPPMIASRGLQKIPRSGVCTLFLYASSTRPLRAPGTRGLQEDRIIHPGSA